MSLSIKLGSLALRTFAKPLANYIKHNAREHERFRQICVKFAQSLHRIDIRLRLGLLQDSSAIERQVQREILEAEARRARTAAPTAKTEKQTKWDEDRLRKEIKEIEDKAKALPRVRPLSESKAIETGANFISESFLFSVAGGIIIFEYWRQRRKEADRRDTVAERLDILQTRISRIESTIDGGAAHKPSILSLPSSKTIDTKNETLKESDDKAVIKASPEAPTESPRDPEGRLEKETNQKH
jgi:hypothetical protein